MPVRTRSRCFGQGMTEYIVIVALIAIAAVAAVSLFGSSVKTQFTALASELVGGEAASESLATQAQTADGGFGDATGETTLQDYAGD